MTKPATAWDCVEEYQRALEGTNWENKKIKLHFTIDVWCYYAPSGDGDLCVLHQFIFFNSAINLSDDLVKVGDCTGCQCEIWQSIHDEFYGELTHCQRCYDELKEKKIQEYFSFMGVYNG